MKNQANLTSEEELELEVLLQSSPCLRIAHELKEELTHILHQCIHTRIESKLILTLAPPDASSSRLLSTSIGNKLTAVLGSS